jgi:hypothetical protein
MDARVKPGHDDGEFGASFEARRYATGTPGSSPGAGSQDDGGQSALLLSFTSAAFFAAWAASVSIAVVCGAFATLPAST